MSHHQPATENDRRRPEEAGFTLVELIVSLMILALIMSFIPGTLRIGQRVWETASAFDDRAAQSSFRRYVEQRLAEAMPIHIRDSRNGLRIEFAGERNELAFVAAAPAGPAGGGVYRFRLGNGEDGAITLRQSLYRNGENAAENESTDTVHLTRGPPLFVSMRYFGSPDLRQAPQWHTIWGSTNSLPELVEISFAGTAAMVRTERSVVRLRLKPGL